jgi:hypothetical protein
MRRELMTGMRPRLFPLCSCFTVLLHCSGSSMLLRLLLVIVSAHVCLAAWADTSTPPKPIVLSDGSLNFDNSKLAVWLRPEELVNMGDSQILDGTSHAWTPKKGTLATTPPSHVNGPMVKRNQANGFPVVRFNRAAIKFDAPTGADRGTVFLVARLDLASSSTAATYQHLWSMGATGNAAQGLAVSKNGNALVGIIGADPPAPIAGPPATSVASTSSVNAGSWHIFALEMKVDATDGHQLYVDGTGATPLAATPTPFAGGTATLAFANAAFQIGNEEDDVNGGLNGDIAEVRCAACIQMPSHASLCNSVT